MTRFESATEVRAAAPGRFTADLDAGYLIGSAMNGGYLMTVLQRAALADPQCAEAGQVHAVASSFHFLRPGAPGAAEAEVEPVKRGRTVTALRATLRQNGKDLVAGTIAAAALSGAEHTYGLPAPDVPPIEECRRFDPRRGATPAEGFTSRVDQFYTETTWRRLTGKDPEPVPELHGYLRLSETDGGDPADPALFLPMAVDALPPVVTVFGSWRWAPTVELTWHLRAVPAPGPLVFRASADAVGDGWFDENVWLWDVKGNLVAQSRQLARTGQ
ncbi:thioesterase family protein [Nocardiopsis coralliicola]